MTVATTPINPLSTPTNLAISGSSTLSVSARYLVLGTASNTGYTLTISSSKSHTIRNVGSNSFTVAVTGASSTLLDAGDELRVSWDPSAGAHKIAKVAAADGAVSGSSTDPVSNAAIKLYVDSADAALETRGTISRISSLGVITPYVPTADTRAARGVALSHAIADANSGDTFILSSGADYEGVNLSFSVPVTVYGNRATLHRISSDDYSYLLQFDGDGSRCYDLTVNGGGTASGTGGLVKGFYITCDDFYGENLGAIGIWGSTASYGQGIRIESAARCVIDGAYVTDARYTGISLKSSDYATIRNAMIFDCHSRSMNIEAEVSNLNRCEFTNITAMATTTGTNCQINFNPTTRISQVFLNNVTIHMMDIISSGISYTSVDREQCIKFQNIDDIRIDNCTFINGTNSGDGNSCAFAFDNVCKRVHCRNSYFAGPIVLSLLRHEAVIIENCMVADVHQDYNHAIYESSTPYLCITNSRIKTHPTGGIIRTKGQYMAYTSGYDVDGTPAAGQVITGVTSGAKGYLMDTATPSSGTWAGGNAQGTIRYIVRKGTFQAGEALAFDPSGATATGGVITGDLGTDRIVLLDNEFVYTGTGSGYVITIEAEMLRGNFICCGNTLTKSAGTFALCQNSKDGNMLMSTDRAGMILYDSTLSGAWTAGGHPSPIWTDAGGWFPTTAVPAVDGVMIRNIRNVLATAGAAEWVSKGGKWLSPDNQYYGTAAPVAGTWLQGDIMWNTSPAAGGTIGWVCTTGGTHPSGPGTWKTFGAITA